MNSSDFRSIIDEVKNQVDIAAVIGETVELRPEGDHYAGLCPFHPETNPSFTVYPTSKSYFCFGCKRGGDVFDFLQEKFGLTFLEALRQLAERTGTLLPKDDWPGIEEERAIEEVLTETARFYHSRLTTEARDYLHGRQVNDEIIDRFLLGYAEVGDALAGHLQAQGYALDLCYRAGVLRSRPETTEGTDGTDDTDGFAASEDSLPHDYFCGRLIFPNLRYGRVVGMQGRSLHDNAEPKYLNLPGPKEHLYNEDALASKKPILVEGAMDAIIATQAGYHAIALLGTQFSLEQASKFKRCDTVHIVLDPDLSGQKAAIEIADQLGDKARLVTLPEGLDPDQFIQERGNEAFDALVACAPDVVDYLLEQIPPDTGKVELTRRLEPVLSRLAAMPGHVVEAYLTDNIRKRFHLTRTDIKAYRDEVVKAQRQAKNLPVAPEQEPRQELAPEYSACFPGLVDLVEQDEQPAYLVKSPRNGELIVCVRWVDESSGMVFLPPSREQIPWLLPNADHVLQFVEEAARRPTSDVDAELHKDLKTYHKLLSELPAEEYYDLFAAWEMHTYLLEQAEFSPYLNLWADPEKGKSRTGKAAIYVAYHGVHVESLREASIIRQAQDLGATLLFDVMNLWSKAEKQNSEDILLLRCERGAKVPRVLYPDRGPFQDTVYYNIFGPTIIATNEPVHHILDTRAVTIIMPETSRKFEQDVKPEFALPLKERLLAFRARHLGERLPDCKKPASGRLGDILKPLIQIVKLACPEREEAFMRLVKYTHASRTTDRATSQEARYLRAIQDAKDKLQGGKLSVQDILSKLNEGRDARYCIRSESAGRKLKSLGFEKDRTSDGHAAIQWNETLLANMCAKYGVTSSEKPSEPSEPSELSGMREIRLTPVEWPTEPVDTEGSEGIEGSEGSTGKHAAPQTTVIDDVAETLAAEADEAGEDDPEPYDDEVPPEGSPTEDSSTVSPGEAATATIALRHNGSYAGSERGAIALTCAEDVRAALPHILSAPVMGLDTETTGLDPMSDGLRLVQLSTPDRVFLIDCFEVCPLVLAPLMEQAKLVVGHNLKFDLAFLAQAGLTIPKGTNLFDTMLAAQLLGAGTDAGQLRHSGLKEVTQHVLDIELDKSLQASAWDGPLSEEQLHYAANDASILLPLASRLKEQLVNAGLDRVAGIEMRALPAIIWLELTGAPFDDDAWAGLSDSALARQAQYEQELKALADATAEGDINWNSPQQVLRLLQGRGHAIEHTDEATLRKIAGGGDPLARLILQYREAKRLASTYGLGFSAKHLHPVTGRVHADYIQIGAASGRMACHNPNLQNIPRDPSYRACFRPEDGRRLVKADYSQVELRIAAELTGDARMREAYLQGLDLHAVTAAAVLGRPYSEVTPEDRQAAKAVNFGLIYGMGAKTLQEYAASNYGVHLTEEEAQTLRRRYFSTYPAIRDWHQDRSNGQVETRTLAGRRRLDVERFTEKLNTPVQGTGADGLKAALALLWETRDRCPTAAPVLVVHDEIVVECPVEDVEEVTRWLTKNMEQGMGCFLTHVPVHVEAKVGRNWGEM